jgi:hypothetical protein
MSSAEVKVGDTVRLNTGHGLTTSVRSKNPMSGMRFSVVSLLAAIGVLSSAVLGASCSSKPSGGSPDSGGPSSSSGGSSGAVDEIPPSACPPLFADDAGLMAPMVSFKSDILPMFAFSCGISSSCHGGNPATDIQQRGLFLGCSAMSIDAGNCQATGDPASQVYAGLVGASANKPIETTCMPFVTPSDPTMSYLMHKMDGGECSLGASCCVAGNQAVKMAEGTTGVTLTGAAWCGTFMPYQVALLPVGPTCGGTTDCTVPTTFARDTVRAWIAQGAMNN